MSDGVDDARRAYESLDEPWRVAIAEAWTSWFVEAPSARARAPQREELGGRVVAFATNVSAHIRRFDGFQPTR